MRLIFFIAGRYLFAKKSTQAINLISAISGLGIFVGTAALLIILSVFNGFEKIAVSMFSSFSPDLLILPVRGNVFNPDSARINALVHRPEIGWAVRALEAKALVKLEKSQYIVTLRGLDSDFVQTHALDSLIRDGKMILQEQGHDYCVLGAGVQARLSANIHDFEPLSVFAPFVIEGSKELNTETFNRLELFPSGIFSAGEDFDDHLVITSLRFVRKLTGVPEKISSIELYLRPQQSIREFQQRATRSLGSGYRVLDRFEQNSVLFKVLNSEKWAVYLMLTFILAIAVFNIMGSLTMLVIEKQQDIGVLSSLGASTQTIRSIFLVEGMLISMLGTGSGLLIGFLFSIAQARFGFITIGDTHSFAVDSYPVVLKATDFIYVFLTVFSLAFFASFLASRQRINSQFSIRESLKEG